MPTDIKLPALSESINEGTVSEVRVKPGDTLKPGDIVVVVEAEKSVVEVPADSSGKVAEVLVKKGDTVKVGQPLARVEAGAAQPAGDKKSKPKADAPSIPEGESPAAAKSIDPGATDAVEHSRKTAAAVAGHPPVGGNGRNGNRPDGPRSDDGVGLVPAGPATRRLARKLGVDLGRVSGTGPRGRVTQDDVIAAARQAHPAAPGAPLAALPPPLPEFSKWGPVEDKALDQIRRKTAEQMAVAWTQIPHVTQHDLADVTDLEAFRKSQSAADGPKLTMTAFILKASAVALKEFPHFNSSLDLAGGRLITKGYYHLGVAVDTDRGLLVPVIRDVDRKSVRELAAEVADLADKARQRKLPIDEMKGGTFTITNLGGIGGTAFTPIIKWPEVAILGLSRAHLEPAVRDGQVVPRLMLPLSLSYDHRVIDGADGARFTRRIAKMLEDPMLLLLDA
jgi:pyruvate dehydrogenase E2 component (dihydrolipoamide acetyltransferase)